MSHGGATKPAEQPPRTAWLRWIMLALLLGTFWVWQAGGRDASHPEVDYSIAYGWIEQGKVARVVLKGRSLDGTLATPQTGGHGGHGGRGGHDRDAGVTRDPVCGMRVDPDSAAGTRTALGRTFYLCSPECLAQVDRDPDHYARQAADEDAGHGRRHRHGGC